MDWMLHACAPPIRPPKQVRSATKPVVPSMSASEVITCATALDIGHRSMATRKANHRKVSVTENPLKVNRRPSVHSKRREDIVKLIKFVDDGISSKNVTFCGPYGRRKVCYCDYAENGRCLSFVEEFLIREVLPFCGDFDSANITSIQSNFFRQEAEGIFRRCVNATEQDRLLFVPRGYSTVEHLIQVLGLSDPVVVFVSCCTPEDCVAPWKALGAKVVHISETKEGVLDLDDLEAQLLLYQGWGQLIGCFTAASPVTGLLVDDVATTLLLHQHGALACWDFTAAAPYTPLDMNPTLLEASAVHKDAMFFSVSKFLGGTMTPSVLVVKNKLASEHSHVLPALSLKRATHWANVVECARAGLVMQLKETIGNPAILSRQEKIIRTTLTHMRNIPELLLLGNVATSPRLPIFSFVVRHPRGAYLHHNFLTAVLNDVFGIQAPSYAAEPYSAALLGITSHIAEQLNITVQQDRSTSLPVTVCQELLKPGYTQITLPYSTSDAELAFILEALKMAATEAWKLLPQYVLNPHTGEWRHYSNTMMRDRKILNSVRYLDGRMVLNERKISTQNACPADYADCLHVARCIFNKARKIAQRYPLADDPGGQDARAESCRWFMLPREAQDLLLGHSQNVKQAVPFSPLHSRVRRCEGQESTNMRNELRPVPPSPTSLSQSLHQIFNPPKVQFVLGPTDGYSSRQRCNSLGSALLRGRASMGLTLPYSRSLPDGEPLSDTNSEELQAYVSEVTRELATEIKSELREVISKVEQSPRPRLERTESFTAASASDIAEYLMGVSREMAREMKCEIRELVSSVVPSEISPMPEKKWTCDRARGIGSESRDSGINLSWSPELRKDFDRSESLDSVDKPATQPKRKVSRANKKWQQEDSSSTTSTTSEESIDEGHLLATSRWQCPPKSIWKPVLEAVEELRMIHEGDSVLVNLLCENSAALLHTLHQLQLHSSSRGVHFSLSALTSGQDDPLLQALGIPAIPIKAGKDGRTCGCGLRRGDLDSLGTNDKFTVLALGDCLDDFAENFILSVFHSGRLKTLKAQTFPTEMNMRIIRPFVYVRAKSIVEFTESRKLRQFAPPCQTCPPSNHFKERERCRELLKQQEATFPRLFTSLRSALHPLIGSKYSSVGYVTDSDELSLL